MRILALDTATEACSVALRDGERSIVRYQELGKSHAQQILDMVDAVLAEAGVTLSMLDGIAASIGPGAFTGVRISVAAAQGLAFGADLPVVPVSTLEALALRALRPEAPQALCCLDARMGEVYWGCFAADPRRGVSALGAARVAAPGTVVLPAGGPYRGIGRGFSAYPALAELPGLILDAEAATALPHAREMAALGAVRLAAGEGLDAAELRPLYLRDNVAQTEAERLAQKSR